jgi:Flp pilus assembly protein TadB
MVSAALGLLAAALALGGPRRARSDPARRLAAARRFTSGRDPSSPARRSVRARSAAEPGDSGAPDEPGAVERGRISAPVLAGVAGGLAVIGLAGSSPPGWAAGAIIGLLCAGVTRRLAAAARRREASRDAADLPLFLDIVATQLRAGAPIGQALARAAPLAPASSGRALLEASGMLRLGAPAAQAWRCAEGTLLEEFAALARRSADNGAQLADQAVRLAADLRARRVAAAESAARRAGVWAMAPLGLCFLPAFVCLGVAPVVLGLVGSALGGGVMPAAP